MQILQINRISTKNYLDFSWHFFSIFPLFSLAMQIKYLLFLIIQGNCECVEPIMQLVTDNNVSDYYYYFFTSNALDVITFYWYIIIYIHRIQRSCQIPYHLFTSAQ